MSLHDELLGPPSIEQLVKNHVKVLRAAIRLKHSIAADNEVAVLLPELRARLAAQQQQGFVDGLTVKELLELADGAGE